MKKIYIAPEIEEKDLKMESLMNTDSSGIYDSGFGAKKFEFDVSNFSFNPTWENKAKEDSAANWIDKVDIFPDVLSKTK